MKVLKPFGRDWPADRVRVSYCDQSMEVARALGGHFGNAPGVEVLHGNLLDLDSDSLVRPANSFGDMGGGIDQPIDRFYKATVRHRAKDQGKTEVPSEACPQADSLG
jgi:hypothetical protein